MELMTLGLHGVERDLTKSWGGSQVLRNMGFPSSPVKFVSTEGGGVNISLKENLIAFSLSFADLQAIEEVEPYYCPVISLAILGTGKTELSPHLFLLALTWSVISPVFPIWAWIPLWLPIAYTGQCVAYKALSGWPSCFTSLTSCCSLLDTLIQPHGMFC